MGLVEEVGDSVVVSSSVEDSVEEWSCVDTTRCCGCFGGNDDTLVEEEVDDDIDESGNVVVVVLGGSSEKALEEETNSIVRGIDLKIIVVCVCRIECS